MVPKTRKVIFKKLREAYTLFEKGEYTRSFNLLSAVERNCDHLYLIIKIANLKIQCQLHLGNIQNAIEYIETQLNKYPLNGSFNLIAGTLYRKLENYNIANRHYLRIVCLYPDNAHYALAYSSYLRERKKIREAIGILAKCLRINKRKKLNNQGSSSIDTYLEYLYLELGMVFYENGHFNKALILLDFCSRFMNDFPYYEVIAEIYLKKRNYNDAYLMMSKHIELFGADDPDTLYLYAKILSGVKKYSESIKALEKCRKIWGELVITVSDMNHLSPLIQNGALDKMPNVIFEI